MEIMQLLHADCSVIMFHAPLRVVVTQQVQHLLGRERGRMRKGFVHALGHMGLLVGTVAGLVGVPFGNVLSKKVDNVTDLASDWSLRNAASFAERSCLCFESLSTLVEPRRCCLPQYVM